MKRIWHIIYWLIITLVLVLVFGKSWGSILQSFYFVTLLLPILVGTSYFFNYYLVPGYLLERQYGYFILYLIYTVIVSLYLEMVVLTASFIYLAHFNFGEMGPYASDALILDIVLYLVVFTSSFILMVRQLYHNQRQILLLREEQERNCNASLAVRVDRKNRQIDFKKLLYLESRGDYLVLVTRDEGELITREKISHMATRLPDQFVRIHRAFIVNRDHVKTYNYSCVQTGEIELPVSRTYKEEALSKLGR